MATTIIDLRKYPFLLTPEQALSIKYPGLRIEDVLSIRESYPYARSLELLKHIVSKATVYEGRGTGEDEVLVFYSLLIGAHALNDQGLIHRIAVAYSKYASSKLSQEPLQVLVVIANRLGVKAVLSNNPPRIPVKLPSSRKAVYLSKPIAIGLKHYLRIVSKRLAHDPKYMLVNQVVDNGRVYVDKETFTRILEEIIYNYIVGLKDQLEYDADKIRDYLSEYKKVLEENEWFKRKQLSVEESDKTLGYVPEALPPCIKILIEKLQTGENLSHHERFTVAAFLVNIGLDVDTILEFFKKTPDFNEKIARYQIEHIAGLRGSKKKYLPYNCDNMKSLGICPLNEYCGNAKNPLGAYKKNLRVIKKKAKEKKEKVKQTA